MTHYATRICTALAMLAGAFFATQGGANAADMKSGETKPQAMKHGHAMHARHGQMHQAMKMDAATMAHHREMMKMHAKHHGKMDHAAMMKMHAMHHGKMHGRHGHKMMSGMPMAMPAAGKPMKMTMSGKAGALCGTYMYRKGGACVDARVTPVKK